MSSGRNWMRQTR